MSFTKSLLAASPSARRGAGRAVRLLLPTAWFAFAAPVFANKCVLIVLPPGGWLQLAPQTRAALLSLAFEGAAGSLSCAVPRPMTEASAWVTLGAGNRAVWLPTQTAPISLALRDSLARNRFVAALRKANARLPYPVEVCSVGQSLRGAGYRTAIVGLSELWHLTAVMDANGELDFVSTSASPDTLGRAIRVADYIVVNAAAARDDARIARLLETAARALRAQDLLIAVGLAPRDPAFVGLTPIVVRGPQTLFSFSQLTSTTTRRSGIVANIDLPPTVLAHFGVSLPPSYRNGGTIGISGRLPLRISQAIAFDVRGRRVHSLRSIFFPLFLLLQAVLVPLAVGRRWPPKSSRRGALMIALVFLPAASHLTAVLPLGWPKAIWIGVVILAAALPAAMFMLSARRTSVLAQQYGFAGAVVVMLILIADQSAGAPLQPVVPIGYAVGFGGRFYGIGNEAAGLLMAAGLLAAGLVLSFGGDVGPRAFGLRRMAAVVLACSPVLVIAWPTMGANAGCTLAAVVSVACFFPATLRLRMNWACLLVVGALAIGVLVLVANLDAIRPADQMTHIGRAWLRLSHEGLPFLAEFARRKATTALNNMRLVPALVPGALWALFWSYALLRPVGFVHRIYQSQPAVEAPLKAIAVGGLLAAFVNDSGISIPVMMLDFALPFLGIAEVTSADE